MGIATRAAKSITITFDPTVRPENDILRERLLDDGGGVFTGRIVTEEKALGFVPVLAAVRLRSETIASLPLHIYQRLDRGKRVAQDHRAYSLLHDMANPEMSAFVFRETMQAFLEAWGNAYAEIEYDTDGFPLYLWPLNPARMQVARDGGQLVYLYRTPDGVEQRLGRSNIFHVPGMGFNGLVGFSPIQMARQSIALGLAAEEMAGRFYTNDARPGVVLKHPNELSDDAAKRLRESFDATHSGLSNKHRTAVLEEGMDIKTIGFPADDAQLIEQQKWSVEQVARIFNVPPHMLHHLERATFNNIEEMGLNFVTYSLNPTLKRWEQQIKLQLLVDDPRHFAEFNVEGLLRGRIADRMAAYWQRFQMGSISPNEIREKENQNPVEGGDVYYRPTNLADLNPPAMETSSLTEQAEVAGALIRAGFDPASVAQVVGLTIQHTGAQPVTVREPGVPALPFRSAKSDDRFGPLFERLTREIVAFEREQVMAEARKRFGEAA